tara:strand:- start:150 stop:1424 length:1275 start_codon:yes stop_codon:yes gene_type:complete
MNTAEGNSNFQLIDLKIGVSARDPQTGNTGLVVQPFGANNLLELHYFEDITKANVIVALKLTDSSSGVLGRLKGMEPVEIVWCDTDEKNYIGYQMVVYDIQDRMILDGKQTQATIFCVAVDAIRNSSLKISRRFGKGGGDFTHEIVRQLFKNDLKSVKEIFVDESETQLSFVSPYWDPYTIISWLSWRSIHKSGSGKKSAGYLFYEDREGYHFKSMDNLVDQDTTRTVHINLDTEDPNKNDIYINAFTLTGTSDIFRGLNLGSYASATYTLDMKDFKYTEVPYFINDFYPEMKKLDAASKLPEFYKRFGGEDLGGGSPTRIMTKVIDSAMYTEGKYTQDLTRQLSQSMIRNQFFFNQSAVFEYAAEHMSLRLAEVVDVIKNDPRSGEVDTQVSGRYIVGKIYRQFLTENDSMTTRVTLFRDSMG